MYLEYWGFSELPFENVPDPRFFYPSGDHQEALLRMFYAVNSRKGAAMLTGEVGCGKTVLSRTLIRDLPQDRYEVGVVANPSLTPIEFLREILYQLGVESADGSNLDLLQALNDQVSKNLNAGRDTVIIIDEAQNLTAHELKTIITRVGENTKIVLTGDIEQIDNVYIDETTNGLTHAVEKFKSYELSGHIALVKGERSKVATTATKIL